MNQILLTASVLSLGLFPFVSASQDVTPAQGNGEAVSPAPRPAQVSRPTLIRAQAPEEPVLVDLEVTPRLTTTAPIVAGQADAPLLLDIQAALSTTTPAEPVQATAPQAKASSMFAEIPTLADLEWTENTATPRSNLDDETEALRKRVRKLEARIEAFLEAQEQQGLQRVRLTPPTAPKTPVRWRTIRPHGQGPLKGVVLDADGHPIEGARVNLRVNESDVVEIDGTHGLRVHSVRVNDEEPQVRVWTTDPEGRFLVDRVHEACEEIEECEEEDGDELHGNFGLFSVDGSGMGFFAIDEDDVHEFEMDPEAAEEWLEHFSEEGLHEWHEEHGEWLEEHEAWLHEHGEWREGQNEWRELHDMWRDDADEDDDDEEAEDEFEWYEHDMDPEALGEYFADEFGDGDGNYFVQGGDGRFVVRVDDGDVEVFEYEMDEEDEEEIDRYFLNVHESFPHRIEVDRNTGRFPTRVRGRSVVRDRESIHEECMELLHEMHNEIQELHNVMREMRADLRELKSSRVRVSPRGRSRR